MKELEKLVFNQLLELDNGFQSKRYLLAVSGGSDSTCLMHVFQQLNLSFEIAHCNFQLRGEESMEDEGFVKETADSLKIKGNYICFNTKEKAVANKRSIQEEARSLRYNWFKELAKKQDFDYIVTAHHQDDLIETFFINTVRGSGIKGLRSIPIKVENIIRPMLNISKEFISEYLLASNLVYRDDSSNDSLKYSRNYLRHKTIPELENVHQNAKKGIANTIDNLISTEKYLQLKLKEDKDRFVKNIEGGIKIELQDSDAIFFLLDVVSKYGFNNTQLKDVLNSKQKGSQFFSKTHLMYKEEFHIIIVEHNKLENITYTIDKLGVYSEPFKISITIEDPVNLIFEPNIAYFDADRIQFPFTLRKWKSGDVFIPFGMKGKKKLSDFFIDIKLSRFEKEQVWILENKGKICWVVEKRLDNRFKITKNTTKIIKIVT